MIKIKPLNDIDKDKHLTLLNDRFYQGLFFGLESLKPKEKYDRGLLEYLANSVDLILVGSASELEGFAHDFCKKYPDFSAYVANPKKGTSPDNRIHKNTLAIVHSCFDYEKFSEKANCWSAYSLVCAHNLRICPYCHAHHINYHVDPTATTLQKQYRIRPPLDHFLPKSIYPYLAVSLYNLIPSCTQCNSSIKSSVDPLSLDLPSPHNNSLAIDIRFSAVGWIPKKLGGTMDDIKIRVIASCDHSKALAENFLLSERYHWYRHEVMDLIDRFDDYDKIPAKLKSVIPVERFVIGCPIGQVENRLIGFCLRDIYQELCDSKKP